MCRNIHTLFNFDPPATEDEIKAASLQFVRKISGFQKPSKTNEDVFNLAVDKISSNVQNLLSELQTDAHPKNREEEHHKAHERALKRFPQQ